MRIIGGRKGSMPLESPEGGKIRPTSDRVREGLFNILSSGKYGNVLATPVIADIFAGTGALGLEAWSRRPAPTQDSAQHIIFIEKDSDALATLDRNIKKLGLGDEAVVIRGDATGDVGGALNWVWGKAGLVFLDPPWIRHDDDEDLARHALENLRAEDALADGALISIEHDYRRPAALPDGFVKLDVRKWGKTSCTLARFEGARFGGA